MSSRLPAEYYEGLEDRLRELVPHVKALVPDELAGWFLEYLDVGEYGLAVEVVSEALDADMPRGRLRPLASGLLAEATLMELPDPVLVRLRELAG